MNEYHVKPRQNGKTLELLRKAGEQVTDRDSFIDFIEGWGLTLDDYKEIRDYLKDKYNINLGVDNSISNTEGGV